MNIDFHYGVTWVLCRLAGFTPEDAETIAHAARYVDDSTKGGALDFAEGQTFERFATAHEVFDVAHNMLPTVDSRVWVPFHFLPGGAGHDFKDMLVCRPDSDIAREMVRAAIDLPPAQADRLHRLGVALHVYADTWAHQGFLGLVDERNRVNDFDPTAFDHRLRDRLGDRLEQAAGRFVGRAQPLGHGCVLHVPDCAYAVWSYRDPATGKLIERDNPAEYTEAADRLLRALRAFRAGKADFESATGLTGGQAA